MVGVFKQKNPGNILFLLVYGLVLKFGILLRPVPPLKLSEDHYLYQLLMRTLGPLQIPAFVYGIIAFLLLFFQAMLLNRICINQKLLGRPNYLPGMAFMLLTTFFTEWNYFSSPLLVSTLLVVIFYRMVNLHNSQKPLAAVFNLGLLMGLVTLLYQPALIFVVMVPLSLFIMRPFRLREWVVGILGLTTPYYFLALEPIFTNRWTWSHLVPEITMDFPAMPSSIFITINIVLLVVPFIIGGYFVQTNLNKMLIQIRKAWSLLLLFLVVSMFIILVNGGVGYVHWMFGLMPLAAFHASTYNYPVKPGFPRVLHWVSFAYAVYLVYGL